MTNIVHQPVSGAAHPGLVEDCALCAARRGPATPDVDLPVQALEAAKRAASDWETVIAGDGKKSIVFRGQRSSDQVAVDILAAAMPAIRRRIADEIQAIRRPRSLTGVEPEDYAEAVGYDVAIDDATQVARGRPVWVEAPRPERPIPQRDFIDLEADAEPYEPQVHRSKPVRPRPNPGGSDA